MPEFEKSVETEDVGVEKADLHELKQHAEVINNALAEGVIQTNNALAEGVIQTNNASAQHPEDTLANDSAKSVESIVEDVVEVKDCGLPKQSEFVAAEREVPEGGDVPVDVKVADREIPKKQEAVALENAGIHNLTTEFQKMTGVLQMTTDVELLKQRMDQLEKLVSQLVINNQSHCSESYHRVFMRIKQREVLFQNYIRDRERARHLNLFKESMAVDAAVLKDEDKINLFGSSIAICIGTEPIAPVQGLREWFDNKVLNVITSWDSLESIFAHLP